MGILNRVSRWFEKRGLTIQMLGMGTEGLPNTTAGVEVNEATAMKCVAVYAAVKVLAESIACLPLITYQRLDRGKDRYLEHPVYRLLHDEPNEEMDSFCFRETLMMHLLLYGNCFAEIERTNSGTILALWPLLPDRMHLDRKSNGQLFYRYGSDDAEVQLLPENVLHIRDMSYDSLVGISRVRLIREAIGWQLAAEQFSQSFFGNGSHFGLYYVAVPNKLQPDGMKNLRESKEALNRGPGNAHKLAVFDNGAELKQLGIPPEQSQFIQSRQFGIAEIARAFRLQPHLLADLTRSSFSNIEQQSLEFVKYTLLPWMRRWEGEINRKLFSTAEKGHIFAEFNADGLLRGDIQSRYNAYHIAITDGWKNRNEIRELENDNPVDGLDVYLSPLNMAPAGQGQDPNQEPDTPTAEPTGLPANPPTGLEAPLALAQRALSDSYQRLWQQSLTSIVGREIVQIKRLIRKSADVSTFYLAADQVYLELFPYAKDQLLPLVQTATEQIATSDKVALPPALSVAAFAATYAEQLAETYITDSKRQIKAAIQAKALDALVQTWADSKAATYAADWTTASLKAIRTWLANGNIGGNTTAGPVSPSAGIALARNRGK